MTPPARYALFTSPPHPQSDPRASPLTSDRGGCLPERARRYSRGGPCSRLLTKVGTTCRLGGSRSQGVHPAPKHFCQASGCGRARTHLLSTTSLARLRPRRLLPSSLLSPPAQASPSPPPLQQPMLPSVSPPPSLLPPSLPPPSLPPPSLPPPSLPPPRPSRRVRLAVGLCAQSRHAGDHPVARDDVSVTNHISTSRRARASQARGPRPALARVALRHGRPDTIHASDGSCRAPAPTRRACGSAVCPGGRARVVLCDRARSGAPVRCCICVVVNAISF